MIGEVFAQQIPFAFTPENLSPEIRVEELEEDLFIYTFSFPVDSLTEPIEIKWESLFNNSYNYWTSGKKGFVKPVWSSGLVTSYGTSQAPVASLFDNDNQNKLTFALSDALNTIQLSSGIIEETANLLNTVRIQPAAFLSKDKYEISLRIDKRNIPYWQALQETSLWWAEMERYKPMSVSVEAKRPMYSTWYSFHQNIDVGDVLKNCRIAKTIGCDAIIVDDGWQTLDNNRGYAFTGDWKPERIPQMKEFVDGVHELDMKFLLWYSVPYVGKFSKAYQQFSDKVLSFDSRKGSAVLDPRYPEVRKYLVDTYVKALAEWNLDGFKLDFVDSFKSSDQSLNEGMDFVNVNEATDKLMTEIKETLMAIKPDVLIEFRQSYIGPVMRKYGNMFRAGDCPISINDNRIKTTDIRLLAGNTATHSDMIMWHPEAEVEDAASQLLNVFFSVPQISVRLDQIPEEHIAMLKFWLGFWENNSEVLLGSELEAYYPNFNYPLLIARGGNKLIASVYESDLIINLDESAAEMARVNIINASGQEQVSVRSETKLLGTLKTYDCVGKVVQKKKIELKGLYQFEVPKSGLLEIEIEKR
tara:strand:+ start:32323 stop:34077 length:1755 start_codon:yes stop_codon:yes gene_type:complete